MSGIRELPWKKTFILMSDGLLQEKKCLNQQSPMMKRSLNRIKDASEASAYLQTALEDGHPKVFLMALRNVALAHGGVAILAKRAKLNLETLQRTLSEKGNPELATLNTVLEVWGFEFSIKPKRGKDGLPEHGPWANSSD